jgi:hypothetical protein
MITEVLAVLSISAAAGFRLALPLLLIGLMSGAWWSQVPVLSNLPPVLVVASLASWTAVELIFSKQVFIQRIIQSAELFLSPFVGAIAGVTLARTFQLDSWLTLLLGSLGSLMALVIHLVQVGWLYRLKRPPHWVVFAEDFICVCLVLFAFDAPHQGGLIALVLVWLALRTSHSWRQWHRRSPSKAVPAHYQHLR